MKSRKHYFSSHESEHTKLMTSLIINLQLAVYRQSLSCEVIDKFKGDSNSSNSNYFSLFPHLRDYFQSFYLDFLCSNLATPITSDRWFSNLRCAGHLIHSGNRSPAPSTFGFNRAPTCSHFSKPPARVLVCESCNSDCSGPFVFTNLVGTHLLHP